MEDVLAKQPFLAGNDYSLADVIWSAILGRLEFIKKLDWIEERPHLARYYQHLKSRPSWESAVMWPQWRYGKMAVTVWSALGPYILMAIGIVLAVTIALSMILGAS